MTAKKKIFWAFVSAILAMVTIYTIYANAPGITWKDIENIVRHADVKWMLLAVLSMLGFIVFEGEAILVLLKQAGYKRNKHQGFLYAAGDIFFSAITPSASGGQPVSALFMIKSSIPASVTTAVLIMNLVMYTMAILTVGTVCIIVAPGIFFNFTPLSRVFIIVGYLVIAVLAVVFIFMLMDRAIIANIGMTLIGLLHKIGFIKNKERKLNRLRRIVEEYHDSAMRIRVDKGSLLKAYLLNLGQRVSQICVSLFMYYAMGGEIRNGLSVWITQALVAIGSNCVPVPGAMGVADFLMLDGFGSIMSRTEAFQLEMLSRSLSFYSCVIISGIAVAFGYVAIFCKGFRRYEAKVGERS